MSMTIDDFVRALLNIKQDIDWRLEEGRIRGTLGEAMEVCPLTAVAFDGDRDFLTPDNGYTAGVDVLHLSQTDTRKILAVSDGDNVSPSLKPLRAKILDVTAARGSVRGRPGFFAWLFGNGD